jgi:hypothetical protein
MNSDLKWIALFGIVGGIALAALLFLVFAVVFILTMIQ